MNRNIYEHADGNVYAIEFRGTRIAEALVYPSGYVTAVRVEKEYRRRGYGRMLMKWLQGDYPRLTLGVLTGNRAAIDLYESVGFVIDPAGSSDEILPGIIDYVWTQEPAPVTSGEAVREHGSSFVDRFARQVSMSIGLGLGSAVRNYAASVIEIDTLKAEIRSICPDRADYYIESARDRVRLGFEIDTVAALSGTAEWLKYAGCEVEIPAEAVGMHMMLELARAGVLVDPDGNTERYITW